MNQTNEKQGISLKGNQSTACNPKGKSVSYPTLKGWGLFEASVLRDLLGFSALACNFTHPPPNGYSIRLEVSAACR